MSETNVNVQQESQANTTAAPGRTGQPLEAGDRYIVAENGYRNLLGLHESSHTFVNGNGHLLTGTLCTRSREKGHVLDGPARKRVVILCHGYQGHKNYLFLPKLARELPFDTFRFDFRGNGGSEGEFTLGGFSDEVNDLECAVDYLIKEHNYDVYAIVGHSRGSVAGLTYAVIHGDKIPHVVNISARFDFSDMIPTEDQLNLLKQPLQTSFIAAGRTVSYEVSQKDAAGVPFYDMSAVIDMSPRVSVLTIHGTEDTTVSISNAVHFANLIPTHTLHLIAGADHNYKGFFDQVCAVTKRYLTLVASADSPFADHSNLPQSLDKIEKIKAVDHTNDTLPPFDHNSVTTHDLGTFGENGALVTLPFPPENAVKVSGGLFGAPARSTAATAVPGVYIHPRWRQMSASRVIPVEGVRNFRDAGGYPTRHGGWMRTRYVFRCAEFSEITENGRDALKQLGIVRVFDLRSDMEVEIRPHGDVGSVTVEHLPVFSIGEYSPTELVKRFHLYTQGTEGFIKAYESILETGQHVFKRICEYILQDGRPFAFNCSAGKDRTGIVAMILQLLAGVDESYICWDYGLTGSLAPPSDYAIGKIVQLSSGNIDVEQAKAMLGTPFKANDNNNDNRPGCMAGTIALLRERYSSVESYLHSCGLTYEQIDILRVKLREPLAAQL
ncbi:tyrosine phosphatase family-domain-containing protein [Syncephalis fuscata]|nr:tyrosine phosphatase family-domain-containing protein [Syncephalis fuscata]